MVIFDLELTLPLQSSDYHLIQFCIQSQYRLTCTMSSQSNRSALRYLLETFPADVLGQIYIYSKNPSFAVANKKISQCLSSQSIRIEFCIRTFPFEFAPPLYANSENTKVLNRAWNLILRQPWFSNNFARKLQREVLRRQKVQARRSYPRRARRHYPSHRVRLAYLTELPKELLLQKPWGPAKVKLIHRLLQWDAGIPTRPRHIADNAMMNAIVENNYPAVNILHKYGRVRFNHQHFRAALLGDCDKRIVEMILGFNNSQPQPFINRFDKQIYDRAKQMDQARNPIGRQLLKDVLWKGYERDLPVATR